MRKQKLNKKKLNKRMALAATAATLSVAVVAAGIFNCLQPMEAYARESFSGTKQIVKEHTNEPFVILDIVPSYATYTWSEDSANPENSETLEFSTGTLSALVKGQAVMEEEYARVYESKASELMKYEARKAFADAVWISDVESDIWNVRYEEAYVGTRKELESADDATKKGWHLLLEQDASVLEDNIGESVSSGMMYGYYIKFEETPADSSNTGNTTETVEADKTGYDYVKIGEWDDEDNFRDLAEAVYVYDTDAGTYRLIFVEQDASTASDDNPVSGYLMRSVREITSENVSEYSDSTGVYSYDEENQRYYYAGVLGDYRSSFGGEEGTADPTATPTAMATTDVAATPTATATTDVAANPTAANPTATATADTAVSPTATTEATAVPTKTPSEEEGGTPAEVPTATPTEKPEDLNEGDETSSQGVLGATRIRFSSLDNVINTEDTTNPENIENAGTGNTYYILEFEYYDSITDPAQVVYQIDRVEEISEEAGEDERPADAYSMYSTGNAASGIALFNTGTGENGQENTEESKAFLYVGPGLGEYRLIDSADVSEDYRNNYAPVKIEVRNAPTYFRFTGGCDWLREAVFHSLEDGDNANTDFKLRVVTLRADKLTMDLIDKADLVYLESGDAPFIHSEGDSTDSHAELCWLGKDKETAKDEDSGQIIGMTRENLYALAYRAVNEQLPVMLDASITENDKLSDSNYQALAGIFLKEDLESYVLDAKTDKDWFVKHLEDEEYPDKTDNGTHYVNRNIYVINSSTPLVNGDFKEEFTQESAQEGFEEVLDFIEAENELSENQEEEQISETVSKARAIEYIINYAVGLVADYTDLKILELQPSSNDNPDLYGENTDGGTTLYFKRSEQGSVKKQVLKSSSEIEVDVTVKSPAALNSEWTDLNSTYNLIFIGLDGQKLNHSSDLWDTIIYNDEELEGKLYHSGDLAAGTDERYDSVDITAGKKQALLDFMKAGYPVLVENDFFKGKTAKNADESDINTEYIAKDTQMYQFLKEAVETDEYAGKIYTIEDVHNNVMFRAQIATDRPVISLREDNDTSGTFAEQGEDGVWSCGISYRISSLYDEEYDGVGTVECYLDINDDGGYSEEERISGYTQEGSRIWAVDEGGRMAIYFAQDPGSRAIPCRLVASDSDNSYLRTEVKGILRVTSGVKEKVRILQIGALDETSLAALYEQENSVLSYYLKEAESTMNADFEITTMSMGNSESVDGKSLSVMLEENPNYLNRYDILVLGFGNEAEQLPTEAVNRFVEEGRSVLISYKGALEEGNRLTLSAELLGQTQGKTYVNLGKDSGNELFRYAGMNAGMFDSLSGLYAEGINEGSIYHYPNEIGKNRGFSGDTLLMAGDYRLDLSNEVFPYVTPWFVLNGNADSAYAYQVSEHDGGNNYYLYSRGNVVYIGHQDYSGYTYQADNEANPIGDGLNECQMFVNAMVLAYNAGIHDIKTDIVAGFEETAAKIESISIPFDQEIAEGAVGESGLLDETVDVYFKYKDSNLAIKKDYELFFYYEDETGSEQLDTGDKIVSVTPFTSEIWTVKENAPVQVNASQLQQGKVYRIKAPVEALKNNSAVTQAGIYVEIRCNMSRPDGEKKVRGCDSVALNRVQLFMLE